MRLEDVTAVCEISEVAMGGARSIRPAFMGRLFTTILLNKTLGRFAPKVHPKMPHLGYRCKKHNICAIRLCL